MLSLRTWESSSCQYCHHCGIARCHNDNLRCRKFGIKVTSISHIYNCMPLFLYLTILYVDIAVFLLTKTTLYITVKSHIPEILSRLRTGFTLDLVKAISVIDASMMLPTPAGLPVSINTTAVAVMASTGTMRMTGLDSIFALFRETNRPVITLTTDVKPRYLRLSKSIWC